MRRRRFARLLAASGGLVSLGLGRATPARACLWDEDTLAQESLGVPHALVAILGGFARNPAKYYEMRLERVSESLAIWTDRYEDFENYDNAAVACDRLGRHDQAIAWMAKKRRALERAGIERRRNASDEHWYRYHANLGTFHAHRWFSEGANFEDLGDLRRAHRLIGEALADNEDAHFGRETYQQQILAWLLTRPSMANKPPVRDGEDDEDDEDDDSARGWDMLPTFVEVQRHDYMFAAYGALAERERLEAAIEGLSGLITLGAAWNSFDVVAALGYCLAAKRDSQVASVAIRRCFEILASGGRSLVAGMPRYRGGDERDAEPVLAMLSSELTGPWSDSQYAQLRATADAWVDQRAAYMNERLERGEHPDTHSAFWREFEGEPSRMSLEELGPEFAAESGEASSEGDAGPVLLGVGLAAAVFALRRRRSRI